MQMERLTVSNIFNREMRRLQLKVFFFKDVEYKSLNSTIEENYCIADNIEFSIRKSE